MKRFNQVISIEVSVDSIASKLLGTFPEDYAHKELLTEAIIGSSLEKDNIGYIYNALNGYSADIDFKVGDFVLCTEEVYDYKEPSEEGRKRDKYRPIGKARIKEINLYKSDKLNVEYYHYSSDGSTKLMTKWVNHKKCNTDAAPFFDEEKVEIPVEEVQMP